MIARKKRKKKPTETQSDFTGGSDFQIYKRGAFIGALIGGVAGIFFGRKVILGLVIGSIAGGYLSYEIYKGDKIYGLEKFKNKKQ